ncbi:MAG: autotransporter assembly complex family protein [Pseudohongiellaceae bacterium]
MKSTLALSLVLLVLPSLTFAQTPGIDIQGAEGALATNIRAHVQLPDLDCAASGVRLARFLPGIRQRVVRAGRALGYYRMQQVTRFEIGESCWNLTIQVDPGEPVRFDEINVAVDENIELFQSALQTLPVSSGQQLNQSAYEQIKTSLSSLAVEQGFFDARYNRSQLQLDLISNTADVDLEFSPGPRYRIGAVDIQQPGELSEEFIERFLNLEPGAFYSSSVLLGMRNNLNSSHYFSSVSVTPLIDEAVNNEVPVRVALSMRPQKVYSAGVGVTTDIGPRLRADYEDRYRNRSGHSFEAHTGVSPIQQDVNFRYSIPMRNPATESLDLSAGYIAEDTDTFVSNSAKVAATYRFINRWDWRQQVSLGVQHDESEIGGEVIEADFVIPGVSLDRTSADDALYPTRGWRLFGELKAASDTLLSSESFVQMNIAGKGIRSVGPGRLMFRFDAGTTMTNDLDSLPTSIRYFAGGDQTVRGYRYESLGPENEAGDVIGGKHKLSVGLEYDFPIMDNWKLAVFTDTGNAFNDFADYELKTGAGIGVRWLSPIGPIRVDLASALDNDNKLRLHITMGPDL